MSFDLRDPASWLSRASLRSGSTVDRARTVTKQSGLSIRIRRCTSTGHNNTSSGTRAAPCNHLRTQPRILGPLAQCTLPPRSTQLRHLRLEQAVRYFSSANGLVREEPTREDTVDVADEAVAPEKRHRHYDTFCESDNATPGTKFPAVAQGLEVLTRRRQARLAVSRIPFLEPRAVLIRRSKLGCCVPNQADGPQHVGDHPGPQAFRICGGQETRCRGVAFLNDTGPSEASVKVSMSRSCCSDWLGTVLALRLRSKTGTSNGRFDGKRPMV